MLVKLCERQELWDLICSQLSGNSICMLAGVREVERATRNTWAFMLLCGRDADGALCLWMDSHNVLRQPFVGWTDHHFRVRHADTAANDRLIQLGDVIVLFLQHKIIHENPFHPFHYSMSTTRSASSLLQLSQGQGAPPFARSSSPIERGECGLLLQPKYSPLQSPPCFPEELHLKEKYRRQLYQERLAFRYLSEPDNPSSGDSNDTSDDGWVSDHE